MKRKFLITNDVGLSLDKVNTVLDYIRTEDGFEYENLNTIDDLLIEVLSHLQQAMDNLGEEDWVVSGWKGFSKLCTTV